MRYKITIERLNWKSYGGVGSDKWGYIVSRNDSISVTGIKTYSALKKDGYYVFFREGPIEENIIGIENNPKKADKRLYSHIKKEAIKISKSSNLRLIDLVRK